MALAKLGSGDEAVELFHMLNPINHARTPAEVERYGASPTWSRGDVYVHPPHPGRGGWTWYTGSAGWMYRVGLEGILGIERRGGAWSSILHAGGVAEVQRGMDSGPTEWEILIEDPSSGAVASPSWSSTAGDRPRRRSRGACPSGPRRGPRRRRRVERAGVGEAGAAVADDPHADALALRRHEVLDLAAVDADLGLAARET